MTPQWQQQPMRDTHVPCLAVAKDRVRNVQWTLPDCCCCVLSGQILPKHENQMCNTVVSLTGTRRAPFQLRQASEAATIYSLGPSHLWILLLLTNASTCCIYSCTVTTFHFRPYLLPHPPVLADLTLVPGISAVLLLTPLLQALPVHILAAAHTTKAPQQEGKAVGGVQNQRTGGKGGSGK